ncbi:hypothetical protein SDJN03_10156, partial [Cucurbita argyrosperma subsp. sororia]
MKSSPKPENSGEALELSGNTMKKRTYAQQIVKRTLTLEQTLPDDLPKEKHRATRDRERICKVFWQGQTHAGTPKLTNPHHKRDRRQLYLLLRYVSRVISAHSSSKTKSESLVFGSLINRSM